MDVISHGLIGKIISFGDKKESAFWPVLFSIIPDFVLVPFYFILGWENKRPFFFPHNSDWTGTTITHPFLTSLYDISHSFLFLFIIILPVILIFKLPKISFLAYFFHIIIDIPTHTGEFAIKMFYPLKFEISGFTDAWEWPIPYMLALWAVLLSLCFFFQLRLSKSRKSGR